MSIGRWPLIAMLALGATSCAVAKRTGPSSPSPSTPVGGRIFPGFGSHTTGGAGRPVFTVETLADSGAGSLRDALTRAGPGGGTIRFSIGGGIDLSASLDVPAHTTIEGSSAPSPGITLWGEHAGARGTGVINIYESDVVVRGLRIRNGMNDGVHVAARNGHAISHIVVEHCSITNNGDGGIDLTGYRGLAVTDVTIVWNYFAGNGGLCWKGTCGGASLMKYGADRVSYYYNLWDKDLRRTPSVSAENLGYEAIADIRYNYVRWPEQSGIQIREGARANVIANTLEGARATIIVKLWGGHAYLEGNPSDLPAGGDIPRPMPVPEIPGPESPADVVSGAGALPRDAIDSHYIDATSTFHEVKAKAFAH
jgi:hypothetical protein